MGGVQSTKGAVPNQPRATPWEKRLEAIQALRGADLRSDLRFQAAQEKAVDFAKASAATPPHPMKPELSFPSPLRPWALISPRRLSARAFLPSAGASRCSASPYPASDRPDRASAESRRASDGRRRGSAERQPASDLRQSRSDGFRPASDQSCPDSDASNVQMDTTFMSTS